MSSRSNLYQNIQKKNSFLCIGLDPVMERIPKEFHNTDNPIFKFNKAIIDATSDLCVAYKPNLAFYESEGVKGIEAFQQTVNYIPEDVLVIADAKRGDIGNTSNRYAKAFFETFQCDAITIAPYMGEDSVTPFLGFKNKWVILLGLTSNKGSSDFQMINSEGKALYAEVIQKAQEWASPDELMFVIGATHPEKFQEIRDLAKDYFFLVPGVGAQGGDLAAICQYGLNDQVGLLVNSSRGIIYAGEKNPSDYMSEVRNAALILQKQMEEILENRI